MDSETDVATLQLSVSINKNCKVPHCKVFQHDEDVENFHVQQLQMFLLACSKAVRCSRSWPAESLLGLGGEGMQRHVVTAAIKDGKLCDRCPGRHVPK